MGGESKLVVDMLSEFKIIEKMTQGFSGFVVGLAFLDGVVLYFPLPPWLKAATVVWSVGMVTVAAVWYARLLRGLIRHRLIQID